MAKNAFYHVCTERRCGWNVKFSVCQCICLCCKVTRFSDKVWIMGGVKKWKKLGKFPKWKGLGQNMIFYDMGGGEGLERGQIVLHNTWTAPHLLSKEGTRRRLNILRCSLVAEEPLWFFILHEIPFFDYKSNFSDLIITTKLGFYITLLCSISFSWHPRVY